VLQASPFEKRSVRMWKLWTWPILLLMEGLVQCGGECSTSSRVELRNADGFPRKDA
jgi:hypothetical protein